MLRNSYSYILEVGKTLCPIIVSHYYPAPTSDFVLTLPPATGLFPAYPLHVRTR
jgi:hypothetical protein